MRPVFMALCSEFWKDLITQFFLSYVMSTEFEVHTEDTPWSLQSAS